MANYTANDIQNAYIAYFGRPAEPTGLNYWLGYASTSSLAGVYLEFSQQPEYLNQYSSYLQLVGGKNVIISGQENNLLDAVYLNLFGRHVDDNGKAFWGPKLVSHANTIADVVIEVSHGATGSDLAALNAKLTAAVAYTAEYASLATANDANGGYGGVAAHAWLAAITTPALGQAAVAGLANLTPHTESPNLVVTTVGTHDTVNLDSKNLNPGDQVTGTGGGTVNLTLSANSTVLTDGQTFSNVGTINIITQGTQVVNATNWNNIGLHTINVTGHGSIHLYDLQQAFNDWDTSTSSHGDTLAITDFVDPTGGVTFGFDNQAIDASNTIVDLTVAEVVANVTIDNTYGATGTPPVDQNGGYSIETLQLHVADTLNHASTITKLHVQGITTLDIDGGLAAQLFKITAPLDASLNTIDANAFVGNLSLNISDKLRTHPISVTLGHGNDLIITGDSLGDILHQDTFHGGAGSDKLTAVFTNSGTRNPISNGIETFDLTFLNSASVSFLDVYDLATINVLPSDHSAKLFDIHTSVHNINLTDTQVGVWQVDFIQGTDNAGGVNGIPEAQYGDLTFNWTDNSNTHNGPGGIAGNTIDQLAGFENVAKLHIVKDGAQDDYINQFAVDNYHTQKLSFDVLGSGLLDVEGYLVSFASTTSYSSFTSNTLGAAAVTDLSFTTHANGDLYVEFAPAEGGIIDTHSLRYLTIAASQAGNIGVGNLLFGSPLQTVNITSQGANVDLLSIQGNDLAAYLQHPFTLTTADLSSTISEIHIDSTNNSSSGGHIAVGRIVAEDISVFTIAAGNHSTVDISPSSIVNNLDPSLPTHSGSVSITNPGIWLTNHGDTFTASGLGTVNPIIFGREAFTSMDFSGLTNSNVNVDYHLATNAVTFTGNNQINTVLAGTGAQTITTGAKADVVTINTASTATTHITTGGGIDLVTLATANGLDNVDLGGTNVQSSAIYSGTITAGSFTGNIDTVVNFNATNDHIVWGVAGFDATNYDEIPGTAYTTFALAVAAADTALATGKVYVYEYNVGNISEGLLFKDTTGDGHADLVIHLMGSTQGTVNGLDGGNIAAAQA